MANTCRFLLAASFIFSGFVKAVDPLGFQYKIQDYLTAFGMASWFPSFFPLLGGIILSAVEFFIGISLFFATRRTLATSLALMLMIFMTPLTLYLAIFDPVSDCGCFGDAWVLTNWETFGKNIILLFAAIMAFRHRRMLIRFISVKMEWLVSLYTLFFVFTLSFYCLDRLPVLDFRPYKIGKNIPEGMTTMEGALVEPAAVGMHAAVLGGAQPGKSIVILGGGTIGLMVLQACISLGATDITVVDVIEKRLELAKKLGAARVINGKEEDTVAVLRSEEMYGDHGVDLVFEAAGAVFTAQQAVQIVSRGGKIMMVGTQSKPVPIDFLKINREVTIQTSFRYCNNFPQTIEAISSGRFNVKDMVTHVYDYKDVQQAFMDAIDPEKKTDMVKGVIKVAE